MKIPFVWSGSGRWESPITDKKIPERFNQDWVALLSSVDAAIIMSVKCVLLPPWTDVLRHPWIYFYLYLGKDRIDTIFTVRSLLIHDSTDGLPRRNKGVSSSSHPSSSSSIFILIHFHVCRTVQSYLFVCAYLRCLVKILEALQNNAEQCMAVQSSAEPDSSHLEHSVESWEQSAPKVPCLLALYPPSGASPVAAFLNPDSSWHEQTRHPTTLKGLGIKFL